MIIHRLTIVILGLFIAFTANAEPKNLSIIATELSNYYDSGQYEKDITIQTQKAQQILAQTAKQNTTHKKLAVVFDIDETALSNIKKIKAILVLINQKDDPLTREQIKYINKYYDKAAIQPVLELYKFALKNNYTIFFVTGRLNTERTNTISNLKKIGYTQWANLYLREPEQYELPPIVFKSAIRTAIEKQGYDIVLNIGDQETDLAGGHADHTIKLPNPYYLIQ